MAQSIALTSGDYTVEGPVRQYIDGVAHDVWAFTFVGVQSAPTGGSWPGSVIRTSITPVAGKCWHPGRYRVQDSVHRLLQDRQRCYREHASSDVHHRHEGPVITWQESSK